MALSHCSLRRSYILATNIRTMVVSTRAYSATNQKETSLKGKYDIIIAGGGMVGGTLACSLGKTKVLSDLSILLLEGAPNKKYEIKEDYSNRVVALNQNTKKLMNQLQVWRHVENARLQPVRHMQVWDASSDSLITFDSSEIMDDDICYIVENDLLLNAVNQELSSNEVNNVDIVYGAKISGYELPKQVDSGAESIVKLENGDTYSCKLLIGADGANSAVRKSMGVQYVTWSYEQMGVVATLELAEECENTTAWQRFLPSGPVALLPLDSRHSSLVWSTTPTHADQLLRHTDECFVDELNDALWKRLPRSRVLESCSTWCDGALRSLGVRAAAAALPPSVRAVRRGSRAKFPLAFGHSARYIAPGVVLVGFPKDPNLQEKWIAATGKCNWKPTKYTKMCSKHFDDNSIVMKNKIKRLDRGSVPAINVHTLSSEVELSIAPSTSSQEPPASLKRKSEDQKLSIAPKRSHMRAWLRKLQRKTHRRIDFLNDAAHRVHPLAGQGVNLGFGDVKQLTTLLADAVYSGNDINHNTWMERYESDRQKHNIPTQLAIEAIHRLNTVDLPPLILLRSVGLQLTNALQPIKKLIMSHAVAT